MFTKTEGICVVWCSFIWMLLCSPSAGHNFFIHANRAAIATTAAAVSGIPTSANRPLRSGRKLSVFFGCRWPMCIQCGHNKCHQCLADYEWDGKGCNKVLHERESDNEKVEIHGKKSVQKAADVREREHQRRDLDGEKYDKETGSAKQKSAQPH